MLSEEAGEGNDLLNNKYVNDKYLNRDLDQSKMI